MKQDRELMQLTRAKLSVDEIATKMEASQAKIVGAAKRLGIYLKPAAPKRDGGPKANAE